MSNLPQIAARAKRLLDHEPRSAERIPRFAKDLLAIWPEAGTIVFPQLTSGHADAFCQLLRDKYDTSVVPGRFFEAPEHFRIGIGGTTENVREGLARMGAALDELAAKS